MQDGSDPSVTPYEEPEPSPPDTVDDEGGSWVRDRLDQHIGGRPLILYLLIAAGVAVLILLAIIILVFARGDGRGGQPICLDIGADDAVNQIFAGTVDHATVIVDNEQSDLGPAAIQLEMSDGTCRVVPQGVDNRDQMLQVLGAIEFTNTIGDRRVRANYERQDVPEELLSTATPTPSPTVVVTATVPAEEGAAPTVDPNAVPTVDPNAGLPSGSPTTPAEVMTPTP